ncbi:MAG: cupin domain-containing protein [Firmicutes bacterium]|nr:cupin domain-containing protein [Bacillota bacterium]
MSNFYYDKDAKLETLVPGQNYRKIKAHDGNVMLVEVIFENGGFGAEHTHPHEQATYCLEGEFEFNVGGEIKKIGVGDTIYMPSDVPHSCKLLTPYGRLLDIFSPQRMDFLGK